MLRYTDVNKAGRWALHFSVRKCWNPFWYRQSQWYYWYLGMSIAACQRSLQSVIRSVFWPLQWKLPRNNIEKQPKRDCLLKKRVAWAVSSFLKWWAHCLTLFFVNKGILLKRIWPPKKDQLCRWILEKRGVHLKNDKNPSNPWVFWVRGSKKKGKRPFEGAAVKLDK